MELKFSGKIETALLKAPIRNSLILPLMTIEPPINIAILLSQPVPVPDITKDLMSGLFLLLHQSPIRQLILFRQIWLREWR